MKASPQQVAKMFGLRTADQLDGRPAPLPPLLTEWAAWPREKRLLFELVQPSALAIVISERLSLTTYEPDGSVKRRYAHNRGMRLAGFVKTTSYKDTAIAQFRRVPYRMGTEIRLWTRRLEDRDRLHDAVLDLVGRRADDQVLERELGNGLHDIGGDVDVDELLGECRDLAAGLQIKALDDEQLSTWLERVLAKVREKSKELGERRVSANTINLVLRDAY